ncbi:portal protein [Croceicoccus mobilis]|uniref:Phage head-tail adapter protein n=1 Tax=Croceicoccus mobilis TaxID=1703339 RepID=A0A917DV35_9SPHN|nr:portal protein [Croceicoccus mobilis]GGD73965.1 hypothetical protein GCM10010990_24470 [Croceicoccus mobilis]
MDDRLQDEELAKADIRDFGRLKEERGPYENMWREIDERFPDGAGGFDQVTPGGIRGAQNFDVTHVTALERFAAAGVAITTPEESQYIRPKFADDELMKIREVRLWCERAGNRLYAIRHASRTGFGTAANEDWDQLGRYGTSPMWTEKRPDGTGLFYRTLHLSETYIDTDFSGLVDTVFRCFKRTARQLSQQFGKAALTPKMIDALENGKEHTQFEILHIVMPNDWWDKDMLDYRRFPIGSRYLALDEKIYLRRGGYHTMPIAVSRHSTSPREKYGRSPAIKVLPAIHGANAMRRTTLRAAHKAVDPAILFNNDDGVTRLSTKPGGLNPGLVSEDGRVLVARMPGGEAGLPFAENEIEVERGVIRTAFLEEFYKILTDPNSRMTTTEVLEVMAKQGVLVRPFASRYATEKQDPVSQREMDIALREGQLEAMPEVVREAGAWPVIEYENMLAAMARAEAVGRTMRYIEALTPMAQIDEGATFDWLDMDELAPGVARELGVNPSYIRDPKVVAQIRSQRAEDKQAAIDAEAMEKSAGAALDLAKAGAVQGGM